MGARPEGSFFIIADVLEDGGVDDAGIREFRCGVLRCGRSVVGRAFVAGATAEGEGRGGRGPGAALGGGVLVLVSYGGGGSDAELLEKLLVPANGLPADSLVIRSGFSGRGFGL